MNAARSCLFAFFIFFRGEQDEGHAVDGVLVFSGSGLAVMFERLFLGGLSSLAGLRGESEQVECLGVAVFRKWRGELYGFRVAAVLEGIHRRFCRTFHFSRHSHRVVTGQ